MPEFYDDKESRPPELRRRELYSKLPDLIARAMTAPGWTETLAGLDPASITSHAALVRNVPGSDSPPRLQIASNVYALAVIANTIRKVFDEELAGTYKLISSTRKIIDTGEVLDTWGANPKGFITYGKDGRMLVLIVTDNRPKPESLAKMTDQQRADLFRTMSAYGGTEVELAGDIRVISSDDPVA